jgi:hypothetical protein
MNKRWSYYTTPCILVSVIAFIVAVIGLASIEEGEGFSIVFLFFFFPASFILMTVDWLVKKITKGNLLYIWIIEIILIIIGVMCLPGFRISGC